MKLEKVEELTNILVEQGYIVEPRLLQFCAEFQERSELLVLTALFRLGSGNSFHQCHSNTYISVSEIRNFFIFLDAIVEMRDDYVYLPRNITEL